MFNLFASKNFAPLFVTQFFGAFNDNFLKIAIVTLFTFNLNYETSQAAMLTNLAMALFISPYFIFSAFAGELTDAFDKAKICRIVKFVEIILMVIASIGFYLQNIPMLMTVLCLMGVQSTFFGPAKYSLLPQQLPTNQLVAGNALIEGGTFIAILTGTILGSVFMSLNSNTLLCSSTLIILAFSGFFASRHIPYAPPMRRLTKPISLNVVSSTIRIIKYGLQRQTLKQLIIPISMFWMVGSLFVSQMPTLCKNVLGADSSVNTILFMAFSIGIAIGSLIANKLLNGEISTRLAVPSAIIMAIATIDLALAANFQANNTTLINASQAFTIFRTWHIFLDLLIIAIAGGIFSVPLQASLQHKSPAGFVARVIACNNIINSFYMAIGAGIAAATVAILHLSVTHIMFVIAAICLLMARNCSKSALN